jgi:peptide-methionine (S)-S-oxide reductase
MHKNSHKLLKNSLVFIALAASLHTQLSLAATATFAGGCFWSIQHDLDKLPGVIKTVVGYTGGKLANPTYEDVSSGTTGHYEAIQITYDPNTLSYEKLVDAYWHDIDPTDAAGQFCDKGTEYHSVIFYEGDTQKKSAETSMQSLKNSGQFQTIATQILPAATFYPAEEYHQHYADKNPARYQLYRIGCGRDKRSADIWNLKK